MYELNDSWCLRVNTLVTIEFYEWKNNLKELYKKIWDQEKDVLTFFSPEMFYKYFSEEFDSKLVQKYWKTKTLIKDSEIARRHIKNNPKSTIKFLPKDFNINVDIIITWNSIIMISFEAYWIKYIIFLFYFQNILNIDIEIMRIIIFFSFCDTYFSRH